jgi:hypothetical protein
MLLSKMSVAWLATMVEVLARKTKVTEFIKSSRDGNKAFIVQSGFNRYGHYLEWQSIQWMVVEVLS